MPKEILRLMPKSVFVFCIVFLDSEVKTSKAGMPLNIPTPFKSENMNCS